MTNFEKSQAHSPVDILQVDRTIPVRAQHADCEVNASLDKRLLLDNCGEPARTSYGMCGGKDYTMAA